MRTASHDAAGFLRRPALDVQAFPGTFVFDNHKPLGPYLIDLIERMSEVTPRSSGTSSFESVSWAAMREAETLADISMVPELLAAAGGTLPHTQRQNCYFTIGKIGVNLRDANCATALLKCLAFEHNKYNLARILDSIGEIPKPVDFEYGAIEPWLHDRRWLVRHAAINAFQNAHGEAAERYVLGHLANTDDPFDQTYCHALLNQIGTSRALPVIEPNTKSRKQNVRLSAQLAAQAIRLRHGAEPGAK